MSLDDDMGDSPLIDIFLVRHGEAAASWGQASDPGLSSLGMEQAESAALQLKSKLSPDVALISSPLLRAQETATPLAQMLDKQVRIDAAYGEIAAPVPLPERQQWLRGFMQQRWQEQPSELHAWKDRAVQSLCALREPTVVFTHFLALNALVATLQKRDETVCFAPANASITHLRSSKGSLQLVSLGRQMESVVN